MNIMGVDLDVLALSHVELMVYWHLLHLVCDPDGNKVKSSL